MKNNSVLILSIQDDQSTNELIMWLNKFELTHIFRLNDENLLDELRLLLTGSEEEVIINGKNLLKFDSIFIRKGQLPRPKIKNKLEDIEFQVVKDYILHRLENSKKCIGSVTEDLNHNKLLDFQVAKKVGLNIPDTWVVRRKQDFKYIPLNQNIEFLIKPLKNYYVAQEDGVEIVLDIFELSNFMESIPINFFPSFVLTPIKQE